MVKDYYRVKGEQYLATHFIDEDGREVLQWIQYVTDSDGVIYLTKNPLYREDILDELNTIMPMHEESIIEKEVE